MQINNISFTLEAYGQEFSFTDKTGNWHGAVLQLPTTPDSKHRISVDDEDDSIFQQLKEYFYSQFKSVEHAKASIITQFHVTHLIEVDSYYVAFSADKAEALDAEITEESIIKPAKKKLFSELSDKLQAECEEYAKSVSFALDSENTISQCFDDLVHDFMRSEFKTSEYDQNENDFSREFYTDHACDIKNNAVEAAICKKNA